MDKKNENSNAQSWELEIVCKNKKYLDKVVIALLEIGIIDFAVEQIENYSDYKGIEGRYTVFMSCAWFHNLKSVARKLNRIEKELD